MDKRTPEDRATRWAQFALTQALHGPIDDDGIDFHTVVKAVEIAMIIKASTHTNWNQSRTAKVLNMKRDSLRYRMKKYKIRSPYSPRAGRPALQPAS